MTASATTEMISIIIMASIGPFFNFPFQSFSSFIKIHSFLSSF